jgi:predicted ATPase
MGALVRAPRFDWIELDGLSCAEVGRVIAQAGVGATPKQVSEIHVRTDGNPFFVTCFARLMATREVARGYQAGVIPSSIRAAIRGRLYGLPERTHDVLVVGAVLGRDFDLKTVATALHAKLDDLVSWVQPAAALGVVTEDPLNPGSYRFGHCLVRDTLRGEMAGLRRCALRDLATRTATERDDTKDDDGERQAEACG